MMPPLCLPELFRRREIFCFFVRPFTPWGWLRSARNFAKTHFRWFPAFDSSTPKMFFDEIFGLKIKHQIKNRSFWRSYAFLSVTSRLSAKNYPFSPEDQVSPFLGEGVQRRILIFSLTFGPKPTYTVSSRMMIWWYNDMMIWWYYDDMTIDEMIIW